MDNDQFHHVDELLNEENGQAAYEELKSVYDAEGELQNNNVDLLWRLSQACFLIGRTLHGDDLRRVEILKEGQTYAVTATDLDPNNANAAVYLAHLTGELIENASITERIKMGLVFKERLDKAIALASNDASLLHMRGRFRYAVASLSWAERALATTLIGPPPRASYDEAIADFLEVEAQDQAQWIANLLYLGKSYLAKGDKVSAIKYWKQAEDIEATESEECEALDEARSLLRKHDK
ncbi:CRE-RMD-2 protein [Aphelenchoides avenae]|nr:CRE-RMD-2 protein [Aphelenchus avenae]